MEKLTQPSTISEMSLEHFEKFMSGIVENVVNRVTNTKLDAIDSQIKQINDNINGLSRVIRAISDDVAQIKIRLNGQETRFYMLESWVMDHDRNLEKQPA